MSILLSATAGAWAWYGPGHWSILAALLPLMLWASSANRIAAATVMASYLGAAGWPVPQAVAVFNDWPLPLTLILFGVYAALYGAFWGLLWRSKPLEQALGLAIAFVALTLPPLGALYFASPLIASGALFPGLGVWGMVATWGLLVCVMVTVRGFAQARKITPLTASTLGVLAIMAGSMNMQSAVQSAHKLSVRAIHTHLPGYPVEVRERYERQFELMGLLETHMSVPGNSRLLLLPEGVAGLREPRVQWMWAEAAERAGAVGLTIAVGNSVVLETADGKATKLVNQVELMGHTSGRLRALVDVPIGSWKPWASSGHYPARWMEATDQVLVDGQPVGAVMCWEELIAWPWLRHASVGTSTILVASNTWFDGGSIDHAQRRSSWALGRLVGVSVVRAANTATH